ncbi:MAG: hypothetical protein ACOCRK_11515, partial [bacterium]
LELKKAAITSGLRGGFIYNNGEYYFPGSIPSSSYSPLFISNMGLNWNYLQANVLVHSQTSLYSPSIYNASQSNYDHTIQDDIEKFVSKEFMNCLSFANVNESFNIDIEKYIGVIQQINYPQNQVKVVGMTGNPGDNIELHIADIHLVGELDNCDGNECFITFSDLADLQSFSIEEIEGSLKVFNMNNTFDLSVKINEENIMAKLIYPVTIANKGYTTSHKESSITAHIRLKKLLDLSKILLQEKHFADNINTNRNINYNIEDNVEKVLNQSNYIQKTNHKNIGFKQKNLVNENERKRYVYSLIDHDNTILGNPFVFNFGYENIAPSINFSKVSANLDLSDDEKIIRLITGKNVPITYDLKNFTYEEQFWDSLIFYFEEYEYNGLDGHFKLTYDGNLTFIGYQNKIYNFNIVVTDGETKREYMMQFVTGLLDNTNNQEAANCFSFKNYEDSGKIFPISSYFKDKVFNFVDTNDKHVLFGLQTYIDKSLSQYNSINIPKSKLYFSKSCVFDENIYDISVELDGSPLSSSQVDKTSDDFHYIIDVPRSSNEQEISILVEDDSGNQLTEDFNFIVYPMKCLGPSDNENVFNNTCCKSDVISQAIENTLNDKDIGHVESVSYSASNMFKTETIINQDMYFCINLEDDEISDYTGLTDYSQDNIWNIHSEITSLFKSKLKVTCDGYYPNPIHNIDSITGSTNFGTLEGIVVDGVVNSNLNNINARFNVEESGQKCEFCLLPDRESFKLIIKSISGDKFLFNVGFPDSSGNSRFAGVAPLPGPANPDLWSHLDSSEKSEITNARFLCDKNNCYGRSFSMNLPDYSTSDPSGWGLFGSIIGKSNFNKEKTEVSRGYCYQDTNTCTGRHNDINYDRIQDSMCRDR